MTNIQTIATDDLEPREKNPNIMTPAQFALLVEAIKRVGFLQPLLVRPMTSADVGLDQRETVRWEIVDGVHRWRAAKEAGLSELACVVVDSDEAEAAALQIGMNRMRGDLDLASVAAQLGELSTAGWSAEDMQLTGFSMEEVTDLLATLTPPDDTDFGGAVGGPDELETKPTPDVFELVIALVDKPSMAKAKRALKRRGKGDLAAGLLAVLAEVE